MFTWQTHFNPLPSAYPSFFHQNNIFVPTFRRSLFSVSVVGLLHVNVCLHFCTVDLYQPSVHNNNKLDPDKRPILICYLNLTILGSKAWGITCTLLYEINTIHEIKINSKICITFSCVYFCECSFLTINYLKWTVNFRNLNNNFYYFGPKFSATSDILDTYERGASDQVEIRQ